MSLARREVDDVTRVQLMVLSRDRERQTTLDHLDDDRSGPRSGR